MSSTTLIVAQTFSVEFLGEEKKKELKYLVITIDQGLSLIPHQKEIKLKINVLTNRLKGLSKSYGLKQRVIKCIYLSAVERMML